MERKRNRPEKYNRNLVRESVKAMEKIAQVCIPPFCRQTAAALSSCLIEQALTFMALWH